ncbi:MAG: hypothetical protein AAGK97_10275, partial [Bacteroidota bacterium]
FLIGLFCGLAILTKWLPGLILLPLFVIINWNISKWNSVLANTVIIIIIAFLISAPWFYYTYSNFTKEYLWEQQYNYLHFIQNIEDHGQPWWYFIDKIRIIINEGIYVILIAVGIVAFQTKSNFKKYFFLFAWILIPFLIFSLAVTKLKGYLLLSFPAYFILIGVFIKELIEDRRWLNDQKYIHYTVLILILVFSIRYSFERIKPFKSYEAKSEIKIKSKRLSLTKNDVIFNVCKPIEWMFYSDATAYEKMPNAKEIELLKAQNFKVYIISETNLPKEILENDQVIILDALTCSN